jgi:uncharacterized protein (TIGR00375 family)
MTFIADLHIHSKYSIATAKNLDLENLAIAAQLKGITLIGTGDFTHPAWRDEIQLKLEPAEPGLFKLRDDLTASLKGHVPDNLQKKVRFILQTEISSIYKKNGKTRKNHNLVFMPDLESAQRLASKLSQIGNICSDGRPILGLDAKDLLCLTLDVNEDSFLIPAHIWTPWFSVLGSKSGFDAIEECFEELTPHIFAVETGLSSDPSMNWRVSGLDKFTLVSNSDAHSPLKVGREANLFNTALNYPSIRQALKNDDRDSFEGTVEFFPEEGKYHLDGHRNCLVQLSPEETRALSGLCPVCGRPLTCGVLHRVEELSNRSEEEKPATARPYCKLIGLAELLAEVFNMGPNTKKVKKHYHRALCKLGDELSILKNISIEQIARADIPLLSEAIDRMREGRINISPGYDGEFGKIQIFGSGERERLLDQKPLFSIPDYPPDQTKDKKKETDQKAVEKTPRQRSESAVPTNRHKRTPTDLNAEQSRAVFHGEGPLLIVAGPGTGKTMTLTRRIIQLIDVKKIDPQKILALTFTNKAAREMHRRINKAQGHKKGYPVIGTFHAFCNQLLSGLLLGEKQDRPITIIDDDESHSMVKEATERVLDRPAPQSIKTDAIRSAIAAAKQRLLGPDAKLNSLVPEKELIIFKKIYDEYERLMKRWGVLDYEGLIFETIRKMEIDDIFLNKMKTLFKYVFVDEYQDLNYGQYELVRRLVSMGAQVCVIGDPDQSIYGFRGSDVRFFHHFLKDYPGTTVVHLNRNYRSTQTIINGAYQILHNQSDNPANRRPAETITPQRTYSQIQGPDHIELINVPTAKAEAVVVGKTIEGLIGGTGFHGYDSGKLDPYQTEATHGFGDFAVLMRTTEQMKAFGDAFQGAGIPFHFSTRGAALKQKDMAAFISYFKICEGRGSFTDIDRIVAWNKPGVGKETLRQFKRWSREKAFTASEALQNATRFPIPDMGLRHQQKLHRFIEQVYKIVNINKGLSVSDKLCRLVSHTPLQGYIHNDTEMTNRFDWLLDVAAGFDDDASSFLSSLAMVTDTDLYDGRAEKVSIMTMHAAKGLEFPVVFICGCEHHLVPYTRKLLDQAALDEERRLLYVAMTRAKKQLFITWSRQRRIFGQTAAQSRSPFIDQIDSALLAEYSMGSLPRKCQRQMTLFKGAGES